MELFAADGHDAGGCERVTGKSGMRPSLRIHPRQALFFENGRRLGTSGSTSTLHPGQKAYSMTRPIRIEHLQGCIDVGRD